MPTITILPHAEYCPLGDTIEAPRGTSLCEALLENGIAIEHACDMVCACTTCHVIVKKGFDSLGEMEEAEEDLLDRAWGVAPTSICRAARSPPTPPWCSRVAASRRVRWAGCRWSASRATLRAS